MNDYTDLNYDQYLNKVDSLPNQGFGSVMTRIEFGASHDVQVRNLQASNLVKTSPAGTAQGSGFNTGVSFKITTTLTSKNSTPFTRIMGIPYVAVYVGTAAVGSQQIYPSYGNGILNSQYVVSSGFDYSAWTGSNAIFRVNVENNSGSTIAVFAVAQWQILNNGGAGSA